MTTSGRAFLVACFWAVSVLGADVTVLYGGNRQGAYDPCGCPVKQIGGLGRWATAVRKRRDASTVVVDAGNSVLPPVGKSEAKRAVAALVAAAYRDQKLDAISPAHGDLAEGVAFAESLELPWVSANLRRSDGTAPFPMFRMGKTQDGKIAMIGLMAPAPGETYRVDDPGPALAKAVDAAVKDGAKRLVVLSSLGISETTRLVGKPPVPTVVVGSSTFESPDVPRKSEHGVLGVETEPEGKHLGVVKFSGRGELVDLDKTWKDDAAVAKRLSAFRKQQRETAAQAAATPAPESKAGYVADAHRCAQCHREQYEFWKKTNHASAYLVLFSKGAHLDPECVVCHSLAFEKPGGFDRVALAVEGKDKKLPKTPIVEQILGKTFAIEKKPLKPLDSREEPARYAKLKARYHAELDRWVKQGKLERVWMGVQCENCHGTRVGHPANGAPPFGKVPETTCKQCHKDPHHPGFDFAALRPKVACPLRKR